MKKNLFNITNSAIILFLCLFITKSAADAPKTTTEYLFNPSTAGIGKLGYKYQCSDPNHIEVRFDAEASNDIYVQFAPDINSNPTDCVLLNIGGNGNTKTWVGNGVLGKKQIIYGSKIDDSIPEGINSYWVKVANQTLTYGRGRNVGKELVGTWSIPTKKFAWVKFGGWNKPVNYTYLVVTGEIREKPNLYKLIKSGDVEAVKVLQASHGGIDSKAFDGGMTGLMWAAQYGNADIVQQFIKAGAQVNLKDNYGYTPLLRATLRYDNTSSAEIVQILLDAGAEVDTEGDSGITPLTTAFSNNEIDAAQKLIAAGADVNRKNKDGRTSLFFVSRTSDFELLIKSGAQIESKDNKGDTPMHFDVYFNRTDMVQKLIEAGANVNSKNNEGKTPLFYALDADMIQKLVTAGADVTIKDNDGKTLLFYANNIDITQKFLELGVQVDIRDKDNRTALFYIRNIDVAKKLIEKGLKLEDKDKDGNTPLHIAFFDALRAAKDTSGRGEDVHNRQQAVIGHLKILLNLGADVKISNNEGKTVLDLANELKAKSGLESQMKWVLTGKKR